MDIRKINEELDKLFEGDVVSFLDYKKRKEQPEDVDTFNLNEINIEIKDIKVLWAEGSHENPWFKSNEVLSYEVFQDRVYQYDYILHTLNNGYDKVKYEANILLNGELDTYTGRVDLGDGRDYVNIIKNMKQFIKEETGEDVNIVNTEAPYKDVEYRKAYELYKKNNPQEQEQIDTPKPVANPKKSAEEVEVGDILYCIWGYSMTIAQFYKVISRTKSSVKLRELESRIVSGDGWQGTCVPTDEEKDNQYVDGKSLRIKSYSEGMVCRINDHSCYYWDGTPKSFDRLD